MATIRLRRRIGAGAGPAPPSSPATAGELRYSSDFYTPGPGPLLPGHELVVDDGARNHYLVSASRQVELVGNQAIGGIKTFAGTAVAAYGGVANMTFVDGVAGEVLTKGAGAAITWAPTTPFTGVTVDASLIGNGLGAPLGISPTVWGIGLTLAGFTASVDFATEAEVEAGISASFAVTPLSLLGALGLPVGDLITTAQTVVPAINEVVGLIAAAGGGLTFAGSYDVAGDFVTAMGPGADGPLPVPGPANDHWFVICTTAGLGTGNAPAEDLLPNDWLISGQSPGAPGTYVWYPLKVGVSAILADTVGVVPPVGGQNTVQAALEFLNTTKLATVAIVTAPEQQLTGDGTPLDPLDIILVDGGTF